MVPLHRVLTADPAMPVRAIRKEDLESVSVDTDQEEVARLVRLGGVPGGRDRARPARAGFTKRLIWRLINLGTALLAASVIGLFEGSIRTLATLAIFMPIVASMGGIGTTQTATVVVRGIALGEMTAGVLGRVLGKEVWLLAFILGFALVFNMVVAAVVGTLVPIALKTFRVDPAIASSVIITTFTDVCGFFSFLGLATLLMRFLL
jgi:magnesium transporter